MNTRYIPAVTMLAAGAITSIVCIINKFDVVYSLAVLLGVMILFFIIGTIGKNVIIHFTKSEPKKPAEEEEKEEDGGDKDENGEEEPYEEEDSL